MAFEMALVGYFGYGAAWAKFWVHGEKQKAAGLAKVLTDE